MQLQSFLPSFVVATVIASSASAIQPSSRGLRDFRDHHDDMFVNRKRTACNPTGNGAGQQDCHAGYWCAFLDNTGRPMEGQCPDPNKLQAGTCLRITRACNRMFRPVCGCDGKTYSNYSCTLGHNIRHEGRCRLPPPDLQ